MLTTKNEVLRNAKNYVKKSIKHGQPKNISNKMKFFKNPSQNIKILTKILKMLEFFRKSLKNIFFEIMTIGGYK